jgi:hypothetical protein
MGNDWIESDTNVHIQEVIDARYAALEASRELGELVVCLCLVREQRDEGTGEACNLECFRIVCIDQHRIALELDEVDISRSGSGDQTQQARAEKRRLSAAHGQGACLAVDEFL